MILALALAVLVSATPAASAGPEGSRAPSDPLIVVNEDGGACRVALAAGGSFRIERGPGGGLSILLPDASQAGAAGEMVSPCMGTVRIGPLADGGVRVDLRASPAGLLSVARSDGNLVLVFDASGSAPAAPGDPGPNYRLGPGDKLTVEVVRPIELKRTVEVDRDGQITFDMVGAVEAAGLTPVELAGRLELLFGPDGRNILVDPKVSVTMEEWVSQFVFVNGEVRSPGKKPLKGGTTLKDVLFAEAQGFTERAGDEVVVTRAGANGDTEKLQMSRRQIERDLANFPLRAGDVITVPQKQWVYIRGEVRQPDRYAYEPGMTLLQFIVMSRGLTEWANPKEIRLLRTVGGELTSWTYNLKDIERLKTPDVSLQPGDIVSVPRRLL